MSHSKTNHMFPSRLMAASIAAVGLSGAAQAALIDRGGGLIYDTDLNVTWLKDANYAQTSGYDADGRMTWDEAVTWAANLSYGGYTDWRLPTTTTTDTATPDCLWAYGGTDCGYNVRPASSEMAHLYFVELGNRSYYNCESTYYGGGYYYNCGYGVVSGAYAGGSNPNSTLDNVGSFINFQSNGYWSGTETTPGADLAWDFNTAYGSQDYCGKACSLYALAVRTGDVAAVPEAETYALMLAGLGLVGWRVRRRG